MIPNPLFSAAGARPQHSAIVSDEGDLTYAELAAAALARAGRFWAAGLRPGQRIGLFGPPTIEWIIDFHGLLTLGAVVTPLSSEMTETEWADAVDAARLAWVHGPIGGSKAGVRRLPVSAATMNCEVAGWQLDAPRLVMLTSGTTAHRRAVPLTTSQLVFSAFGSAIRLGHDPADRWLACLPLHHMGGISVLVRAALYGITVVLEAGFTPSRVNAALDSGAATIVSLVPTMLTRLLDHRRDRPFADTVRCLLIGGAAMPAALRRRSAAISAPVSVTWGMTEAASQVCTRAPGDLDGEGVGPPLAFARVDVQDGRLRVHGPQVGGLLVTGDAGTVDHEVVVLGRADDVIVSGGVNLSPAEIEDVLALHPGVAEALVVGRPHPTWGQRPVAVLVAEEPNSPPAIEALDAHCGDHLASYKRPDAYAWWPRVPRDALGKRRRGLVREALAGNPTHPLVEVRGGQEPHSRQTGVEDGRALGRSEVGEAHEGVLEADRRPQVLGVPLTVEAVDEGDGAAGDGLHLHGDLQSVTLTHGPAKARLGVDQGEGEAQLAEDAVGAAEGGVQHLLEADVSVLEDVTKEDDAGAIHLVESGRDRIPKRHELSGAKGP